MKQRDSRDSENRIMTSNYDAFAIPNSSLNPFLFARVGSEINGSELTILSLLARLGSDPWAEASRVAALPKAAAANWLAQLIVQMPLTGQAIDEAGITAAKLVLLLPSQRPLRFQTATPTPVQVGTTPLLQWVMIALVWGIFAIGMAAGAIQNSTTGASPATTDDPAKYEH